MLQIIHHVSVSAGLWSKVQWKLCRSERISFCGSRKVTQSHSNPNQSVNRRAFLLTADTPWCLSAGCQSIYCDYFWWFPQFDFIKFVAFVVCSPVLLVGTSSDSWLPTDSVIEAPMPLHQDLKFCRTLRIFCPSLGWKTQSVGPLGPFLFAPCEDVLLLKSNAAAVSPPSMLGQAAHSKCTFR